LRARCLLSTWRDGQAISRFAGWSRCAAATGAHRAISSVDARRSTRARGEPCATS
jgi:hypothetical protein